MPIHFCKPTIDKDNVNIFFTRDQIDSETVSEHIQPMSVWINSIDYKQI